MPHGELAGPRLTAPDEPIRAIRSFSAGITLYPIFYAMQAYGLWTASGHSILWTSIFVLSLAPSGFFSLRYHRQLTKYRDRIITRTLFLTDGFLVQRLSVERLKILSILSDLKDRFIAETSSELEAHIDRKSGLGADVAP